MPRNKPFTTEQLPDGIVSLQDALAVYNTLTPSELHLTDVRHFGRYITQAYRHLGHYQNNGPEQYLIGVKLARLEYHVKTRLALGREPLEADLLDLPYKIDKIAQKWSWSDETNKKRSLAAKAYWANKRKAKVKNV